MYIHHRLLAYVRVQCTYIIGLKRLSHEIFGPVFWVVGMYLGLNMNRLWFLNLNAAPLIIDNYFSFDPFQAKLSRDS
jgi:hypothetical protein